MLAISSRKRSGYSRIARINRYCQAAKKGASSWFLGTLQIDNSAHTVTSTLFQNFSHSVRYTFDISCPRFNLEATQASILG
ncbi:hypothetical protein PM082_009735 [Marasmius tenuissimus]|nr:hypothetical protein PM082_009735 [Marasmius tenuissimus]